MRSDLKLVALIVTTLISTKSFAWDLVGRENNYQHFQKNEFSKILEKSEKFKFRGVKDKQLVGYYFPAEEKNKKVVAISPGWSEPSRLYLELVYDLNRVGFDVYIMDHRGQGESERFIDCECSHIDNSLYYVQDFKKFLTDYILIKNPEQLIVFGHSMGAAVAALAASDMPEKINRLVLSAPLFQVNTGAFPEFAARLIVSSLVQLGWGQARRPFDSDGPSEFSTNRWTQSRPRYEYAKWLSNDLGAPKIKYFTNRWLHELFKLTDALNNKHEELLKAPTLILQAETEHYVLSIRQDEICRAASQCTLIQIPKSRHCIFLETDEVRAQAVQALLSFTEN